MPPLRTGTYRSGGLAPEAIPAPSDADLRAYFAANAQNYAVPDRVSFDQVFLGDPAPGAVEVALTALQSG